MDFACTEFCLVAKRLEHFFDFSCIVMITEDIDGFNFTEIPCLQMPGKGLNT